MRAARWALLVAGVLTFGVFGLAFVVAWRGRRNEAGPAEVLVVLGARVGPDGRPSRALRARVDWTARLYHEGLAPLLVLSGGSPDGGPCEARAMALLALEAGIPAGALRLEERSRTTRENAREVARLLGPAPGRVLLVTDDFHACRARAAFAREGLSVRVSPAHRGPGERPWMDWIYWMVREAFALLFERTLARPPAALPEGQIMATPAHPPVTRTPSTDPRTFSFWWARTASFLAILPLGVWTFVHLWNNLYAFRGAQAWQEHVTASAHPVAEVLNLVIVLLPLVLHTVWGIQRLGSARPNTYGTYGNLKYWLQRVTAIGVLFFLAAHIYKAYLAPRLAEHQPEQFADFAREMHNHLPTLIVYLLGTLGVAFHLANGISTFGWTWGLVAGRRSVARVDKLSIVLFLLLLVMAWGAIWALYSAGANLSSAG